MLATFMSISPEQAELNQELRSYAKRSPVVIVQPSLEEAIAAIQPHFPELAAQATEVQMLLDEVGLPVITDIGQNFMPMRISWSIVETESEANQDLQRYSQASFSEVRKHLGIDYHWIFLVPFRSLIPSTYEDLMEGTGDFREAGRPECWILDRFR